MNNAWGTLVPELEGLDASDSGLRGKSFVEASAAASKNDSNVGREVEAVTTDVQNMAMPAYPPPPEPTSNGMESSVLNEAVRYRTVDPLPTEE
eukprot:scaffold26725_cov72-Skeletonema_dohrnii-CCMP3373.AAC.3